MSANPPYSSQHSSNRCVQQRKCTIIGNKQLQEYGTRQLWTAHIKQKSSVTLTVGSWNKCKAVYIASYDLRDFHGVAAKLKESIFKNNNQIKSTVTTRTWVLSTEWTIERGFCRQSVANYKIGIQMRKWWWSPFFWIVDIVLQGASVLNRNNKDEGDESLPLSLSL